MCSPPSINNDRKRSASQCDICEVFDIILVSQAASTPQIRSFSNSPFGYSSPNAANRNTSSFCVSGNSSCNEQ